ncbi:hypothetical protein A6R68_12415 [Neotoma lepida]|uniref:SoHo domain-containing protein n=1 Tax=Neotoma lepida TaxID=56216 RepID=A0A1A6H362_NEOLE|nr:hypothetical protein A6R68_12415 [Neotoma lepida]
MVALTPLISSSMTLRPGLCAMAMPHSGEMVPSIQNWSATWTKDNRRRDKRWVKYEGIGPVDESGMPIAPRSTCSWTGPWKNHTKGFPHSPLLQTEGIQGPSKHLPPGLAPQQLLAEETGTTLNRHLETPLTIISDHPLWGSSHQIRRHEKVENVWTEDSWNQFLQEIETGHKPKKPLVDDPVEKPAQPIEVLLERELAKLSAELDKDLRAIETRLPSPKVPASRGLQEEKALAVAAGD